MAALLGARRRALAAIVRMAEDPASRARDRGARRVWLVAAPRPDRFRRARAAGKHGWVTAISRRSSSPRSRTPDDDLRRSDGRLRFGAAVPSAFTLDHCWGLLGATRYESSARSKVPISRARARCGAAIWRWLPILRARRTCRVRRGILFLEDIGEHPYRIERMLYQLHHAGCSFANAPVLLGDFSDYELGPNDNGYDAAAMVAHLRARLDVPLYTGFPFGHCPEKLTLPVGGRCAITVRNGAAKLVLSDYAPRS
jgi:hypothetical protein